MINKEELKELFLKLTEYTIPFGYEHLLEKYLPNGFKKDKFGNYFYEIGESETLFTTHLDTFSEKYQKVNHIIDEFIIGTDKTTILGGDNKLGTSILINMINENIQGTYYFFRGEEPLKSGGLWGSRMALNSNPDFFKKFKRAIAFDRREYGSIVTRQRGRNCCSMEFASALANNLNEISGIEWDKTGGFGYYTDTAVFMDVIPEITNLSVGGFKEHHMDEYVDLNYTYKVLEAALSIDWESLPVVRELDEIEEETNGVSNFDKFYQKGLIDNITNIMDIFELSLVKTRKKSDTIELTYSMWLEDFDLKVIIDGRNILINGQTLTYTEFIDYFINEYGEDIIGTIEYYQEVKQPKIVDKILKSLKCKSVEELKSKIN